MKREWRGSQRGVEREMRGGGGTGRQMLTQQCSMLVTTTTAPSLCLITGPPIPCPSVTPSLIFGPSHNLCSPSDHTERLESGGERRLTVKGSLFLLFFVKSWDRNNIFFFITKGFFSDLDYDCGALCALFLSSPQGITTGIVVCVCVCVLVCVGPA